VSVPTASLQRSISIGSFDTAKEALEGYESYEIERRVTDSANFGTAFAMAAVRRAAELGLGWSTVPDFASSMGLRFADLFLCNLHGHLPERWPQDR